MTSAIAYIPFLDPLNALQDWWYLLIVPLSFGISVVYRALRTPRLTRFWKGVAIMTVQIVAAMVALAIGLVILVELVIPQLPAD